MDRRTFVRAVGSAGVLAGLGGCLTRDGNGPENGTDGEDGDGGSNATDGGGEDGEGTLRVATYESMVDAENPAGPWIKEAFEAANPGTEIDWTVPESGLNLYVQQAEQGAGVDADVYFGLNVDDLVQVDDELGEGALFRELDRERVERADRVRDDLEMGDPAGRVLPYDTGYISLVYDEDVVDEPETFDDLLDPAYEDALLVQNAQTSDPGRAFLLWTISEFGEDYLDYWSGLRDNGVRIIDDWTESYYGAYMNEERPMVVSYSTDQVFASEEGYDMSRHQVAFPDGQGYANPEGMAIFEDTNRADLAYAFVDFVLSAEAQAEIAVRNVQFPAVGDDHVDLPDEFDRYAHEPPEPVTMGYDDLRGNVDGWVEEWAREFASQ